MTTDTFSFAVSGTPASPATGTLRVYWSAGSDLVRNTFDNLGRTTSTTDQRAVTHSYSFDALGRLSFDAVTAKPASVDGAILGIGRTYDTAGRAETITSYAGTSTASSYSSGEVQVAETIGPGA